MLPNWLYGKSKSKLASILGGGGAPADYDQVKAQVNQNTENILTLSNAVDAKVGWSDYAQVGAVNLFAITVTTQTVSGITYTVRDDKSIITSGESSASGGLMIGQISLKSGMTYKLTGCPSDGGDSSYELVLRTGNTISSPLYKGILETGEGVTFTADEDITVYGQIRYASGISAVETFYPMIAPADYNGPYVPPAMTNRELTQRILALINSNP